MTNRIDKDKQRFDDIIKGRVKKGFKRYIVNRELVIPKQNGKYQLQIPQIRLPKFTYGQNAEGVGQGDGDEGDPYPTADPDKTGKGEHNLELEVTLEELASLFCDALELPRLQNKGKKQISTPSQKYTGLSRTGPKSLVNFKRTYKEALARSILEETYEEGRPPQICERDFRYKAPKIKTMPDTRALILYGMDVSGSMNAELKELVRTECFWLDIYLRSQYKQLESRYIIHDTTAAEVDQDAFYRTSSAGGTKLSSPLELADKIITKDHSPTEWNIYLFQFSDGDNDPNDNEFALHQIAKLLPQVNQYSYTEVMDKGSFKQMIDIFFDGQNKVVTAELNNKVGILRSLKQLLGKGN